MVRRYFRLRGVTSPGTLAALASDESKFREIIIDPMAGFRSGGETLRVEVQDKPIAAAVMLYMRQLALKEQAPAPSVTTPGSAGVVSSPPVHGDGLGFSLG